MKDLRWRILVVVAIVAVALLYLLPTLSKELPRWWTNVFPSEKLHLGLDLQGGMHLLLEVQTEKAVQNTAERLAQEMKDEFREAQIRFPQVERQGEDRSHRWQPRHLMGSWLGEAFQPSIYVKLNGQSASGKPIANTTRVYPRPLAGSTLQWGVCT